MKKGFYITTFFVISTTLNTYAQKNTFLKASWLIGKWSQVSLQGTVTETWTVKDDSTYSGKTYFVMGKDTAFSETINLEQRGNDLFYVTQVSNQNDGKSISFKLTSSSKTKLIFENPQHDFPKKIVYMKKGSNAILVEVSGTNNGKSSTQKFEMTSVE